MRLTQKKRPAPYNYITMLNLVVMSMSVGISREPQKLGSVGPRPLGWMVWRPIPKHILLRVCYHTEFGHSTSKGEGFKEGRTTTVRNAGAPSPWDAVRG